MPVDDSYDPGGGKPPPDDQPPFLRPDYRSMDLPADADTTPPPAVADAAPPIADDGWGHERLPGFAGAVPAQQPVLHGTHGEYGTTGTPMRPQSGLRMFLRTIVVPFGLLLLFGFKWLKFAFIAIKGIKFAGTAITMVVSVGAYALFWGLPFAIGFVALIFVHEMGHAIQMRREGLRSGPIVFIPFLGAAIAMRSMPHNALVEARVGLAGPILGSVGALVVYAAALQLDSLFLQALAFTGFFLNLFNLIPIVPLDGGRAAAALNPAVWFGGLALMAGMLFVIGPNPVIILILIVGVFEGWGRWKSRHDQQAYYRSVTPAQRTGIAMTLIGLVVVLAALMNLSFPGDVTG